MSEVYRQNGEIISVVNCPKGFTITPPGMKPQDAEKISDGEYRAIMEVVEEQAKDYVDPTQKKIAELEAKVDELQQSQSKDIK